MKQILLIVLAASLGGASQSHAAKQSQPFEAIRHVQDAQDAIAVGQKPLEANDQDLSAFLQTAVKPEADWSDRRNVSALAFYLLAGGDPDAIRPIIGRMPRASAGEKIIQNVFAYADDARDAKEDGLEALDPRFASPEIGGAVALAQARVLSRTDKARAIERYRAARFLAPGGLIEEISLREELAHLDRASNHLAVQAVARRYSARYLHSDNAVSFFNRLDKLVEDMWSGRDANGREQLISALDDLAPDKKVRLFLKMARWSLVQGDAATTLRLTKRACANVERETESREQCDLYDALAAMFGRSPGDGDMDRLSTGHLSAVDRLLRECARLAVSGSSKDAVAAPTSQMSVDDMYEPSEIARRARERLARTERFLAGGE